MTNTGSFVKELIKKKSNDILVIFLIVSPLKHEEVWRYYSEIPV